MSSGDAYVGCEATVDFNTGRRSNNSYRSGKSDRSDKSVEEATIPVEEPRGGGRDLNKARTMAPHRSFQRTVSPKPSRTGAPTGLEMEPLVKQLASADVAAARDASATIRGALKNCPAENKARLLAAGGIDALVGLLASADPDSVDNAMAAILSMSLTDGVEPLITRNHGLEAIAGVLQTGSTHARETAAAAIFTLSSSTENKDRVRKAGGIPPLVELLKAGTLRGKKDASLALFNLALEDKCAKEMIAEGAPAALFTLLSAGESDPGLEDKVVAVVANLSKCQEGREAILAVDQCVGVLVDIVDGGSPRSKEDAVVALYQLATHLPQSTRLILDEGAMPALGKLSLSGTPRAKSKSKALLDLLRTVKGLGNSGRSSNFSSSPAHSPPVSNMSNNSIHNS